MKKLKITFFKVNGKMNFVEEVDVNQENFTVSDTNEIIKFIARKFPVAEYSDYFFELWTKDESGCNIRLVKNGA